MNSLRKQRLFVVAIIGLLLISLIAVTGYTAFNKKTKQFYVGVTYCGSSIQEAKDLIDKVKNYTNLFILQSGPLLTNIEAIYEIGDYVCAANLNYAVYVSKNTAYTLKIWVIEAKERWGEQFIGIYYNDEPGGNMLDNNEHLSHQTTVNNVTTSIQRHTSGTILFHEYLDDGSVSTFRIYLPDGRIDIHKDNSTKIMEQDPMSLPEENRPANGTTVGSYKYYSLLSAYYPNGTITITETIDEGILQYRITEITPQYLITESSETSLSIEFSPAYIEQTSEKYITNVYTSQNITKYPYEILSYEEVLKQNPLQTVDDVAEVFVNMNKENLKNVREQLQEESILVFTADYGLYWWDYKGGYDVVLAELGWNHTMSQDIGLVRGAAKMQNKSWGTIITWKYDQPPYLADGNETYNQLKTSYEAGAEYVIIFNYSEDKEKHNTLQEEHFQALERFWNDVVQNPKVKHGGIKAEAVLVLPQNYGWGMRHPNDHIWGIWPTDDRSQQIWNQLQNKIDKHGLKLDIIFEDPSYHIGWKYSNIYYWNQK